MNVPHLNLQLAWLWIVFGLGSGLLLGLFFHRDDWLGGYGSLKRRLYRLGHISFFGLGLLNLCFFVTTRHWPMAEPWLGLAGWGFVAGAIAMPLCCVLMAHWPRAHSLFALPVSCLLLGGITVLACVGRSQPKLDSPAPLLSETPRAATSAL